MRTLRFWDVEDRLRGTGVLEEWADSVQFGTRSVSFEVEFWYRAGVILRNFLSDGFRKVLEEEGGAVMQEIVLPEIAYHGMLGTLPIEQAQRVLAQDYIKLVRCDDVMFFRPSGQLACPVAAADAEPDERVPPTVDSEGRRPVVGVLDGLPLENHTWLAGRLIVDDPDDFGSNYEARARSHGTSMASLILNGDLNGNPEPLSRPLYVRPIMRPRPDFRGNLQEVIPSDRLIVDQVHQAVRDMLGDRTSDGSAPTVQIINFSIGDRYFQFDRWMSPLARLLDWLSWKYGVLFLVSAGNHPTEITIPVPVEEWRAMTPEQKRDAVYAFITENSHYRRLLTPAEAVNALTVGALHSDHAEWTEMADIFDVVPTPGLPSPLNPVGMGYDRAVKPEILMPGGRQLFRLGAGSGQEVTVLEPLLGAARLPGQRVAAPGRAPGDANYTVQTFGTSNATALATRAGALLYEDLIELQSQSSELRLPRDLFPVLIKALLVHSASWDGQRGQIAVPGPHIGGATSERDFLPRLVGYGRAETSRVFTGTDQRVTLVACGRIEDNQSQVYTLPIPECLIGQAVQRRLTVTLAYLTPIQPSTKAYRAVRVWAETTHGVLEVSRRDAQAAATMRGTVQHDVCEGKTALSVNHEGGLKLTVNCKVDGSCGADPVPYGLAITLEVPSDCGLPVYAQVLHAVRPQIGVRP